MYDRTMLDTLNYHLSMLGDEARTGAYLRAIMNAVTPGDIVLDIGSGTGVLAIFACIAGAEHVYAVEQGPVIGVAPIAQHNGFTDRITFLEEWSTEIELPTSADVIISETIGNAGFDEGLLGWIQDAKRRLLADGGRIIPQQLEMVATPIESEEDYAQIADWRWPFYSLDYRPAGKLATNSLHWTELRVESLLADPATIASADLQHLTRTDVEGERTFEITRNGVVHGLGVWFVAELYAGIRLSNAPPNPTPSWTHGFLPIEEPLAVVAGDRLHVTISTGANAGQWRWRVSNSHDADVGGNGQSETSTPHQRTEAGEFPRALGEDFLSWTPSLSRDAEIDQFILNAMDGATPVAEIIRQLEVYLPHRFPREQEIAARVHEICAYYSLSRRKKNA